MPIRFNPLPYQFDVVGTGTGPGSGDVVGPASAVDDNFAAFDGTTGKLIKDSGFSDSSFLKVANDLSDLNDVPTARSNLGLGPLTNGQLIIGSTGNDPVLGLPTAIGVNVVPGAGSLRYDAYNFDIGVANLGITYNAGTGLFSITSASGTALSSSNPGYVTLPSKSAPGTKVTVQVTADQTFIDDNGSSTIIGNLFGLTTGIAHADPIPFFIYAVLNDNENAISFMVSRYPNTSTSPVAAKIGKTGSAVADTQGSFFALGDPTVADYEQNPCMPIGAFRMSMSASDDWTVEALSNTVGIGRNFLIQRSNFVSKGQFGAAPGKWFLNNGGTAPDQTVGNFEYSYSVNAITNEFKFSLYLSNVNVVGGGAVGSRLASPYISGQTRFIGTGDFFSGGQYSMVNCIYSGISPLSIQFDYVNPIAANILQNQNYLAGTIVSFTGTFTPLFS